MYFKRIEMHGFKSFAEPVTIEFREGITCVVGPNGSGKSNISDAIRWVLGEQSPKMLRGGKMEEVIFAGTASRKSRGMAEVTLVIDNTGGHLPIDYNEVAITRRMFRSGESEYAINNNQCRRRDIRELIMDTGIGVDGYSLIGQGKISDIVSNKTDSRREIFEEAAGIVMYRTKKAESERKLESAQANLERVGDIIGEIEGRIDGLRDDSVKAKEYVELRERHKELEINITLKNIENLELKNEYIKDDLMELQVKLDQDKDTREETDQKLEACREQSESLEHKLTENREKLMKTVEEIHALVNRGQLSDQRLKTIEENTARLQSELEALAEKLQQEETNAQTLTQQKQALDGEMSERNQALQGQIGKHSALAGELAQATQDIDDQKNQLFQTHNKISSQQAEIKSLQSLRETLEDRKTKLLEEKGSGEDDNRDMLDILNRMKAEREDLQEEQTRLAAESQAQRQKHNEALLDQRKHTADIERLKLTIGQLSSRKKTIEEMESNYEGYNYGVKHIMKAGLSGIHGTVAQLIQVPQGLEVAVETALGAAMQNIVCQDDQSAQKAIEELKRNKAGRLTFLPLRSIKANPRSRNDDLSARQGFQGFGPDCVEVDQQYRPIIEYLLGRVVVVDSMDNAVKLSKQASGLRFVTLEGEIINAGGAITGGKYKNKTANLLERKAEITQLEQQIQTKQKAQQEAQNQLEALTKTIEAAAETIKGQEEAHRQNELALLGKENEIQIAENALRDFKENSTKQQQELDNLQREHTASQTMIADLEQQIEQGKKSIAQAETTIEQQLQSCEEKKAQIQELNETITAARIEVSTCEEKKNNLDDILSRIQQTTAERKEECRLKEQELEALNREKEDLSQDHTGGETALRQKQEAKEALDAYIAELMEERTAAVAETNRLAEAKETLDQALGTFQNQKYELEIKQAKNETQLDTYKEKLWEDFEVSYIQAMEFKNKAFDMAPAQKESRQIKTRMKQLGEVNIGAIAEYDTVKERYEFLTTQRDDILEAMESLNKIISDMDRTIKAKFQESFDQVAIHFEDVFKQLFGGGQAELRLEGDKDPLESEIEIIAQPPGKKLQNINLLSGGEKTMTAIALMFAVLRTKPTPFCILDEVEAALDDANIDRFAQYLKTFTEIQFTLVTHQKATMEYADTLYGVTMPEQGISKVLSLDLTQDFTL